MFRVFSRRKGPHPYRHTHDKPTMPGAYLFTLRSVPRHYAVLRQAIESTGEARVWFGENLAYIRGKGVALFRIEATGFRWLQPLYERWREIEQREAFPFEIDLYVRNKQWLASLRDHSPEQIERLVRENAPTHQTEA